MLRLRSTSSSADVLVSPRKLAQSQPTTSVASNTSGNQADSTHRTRPTGSLHSHSEPASTPVLQAHSAPTLQIVRTRVPMSQLKKAELENKLTKLADLLVNDLLSGDLSAANLKVLGRVDSAFYIDRLPPEFQALAQGLETPTIPFSRLLQRFLATDFRGTIAWGAAKTLYSNFRFEETKRAAAGRAVAVGDISPDVKQAEMMRMQGLAEVIVRTLLGFPPTVDSSPLPAKLIRLLIVCDQRLHAKLLDGDGKTRFSTDQIRSARLALLTDLLVTRLLQPMLSSLAATKPTQSEMWFLTLLMKGLVNGAQRLSDALFSKSFASSPLALRQKAEEKLQREKIDARIRQLQSKPTVRHVRTRSADTEPISPRTLRTVEQARNFRAMQKAAETARALEAQDWSALDDAKREVDENLAIEKAHTDLQDFDADDLEMLVMSLLDQRDGNDDADFMPISPRRATALDDSDELPTVTTTTTSAFTTTTTTTTSATVTATTRTASDALSGIRVDTDTVTSATSGNSSSSNSSNSDSGISGAHLADDTATPTTTSGQPSNPTA